jgi:hypothetical protein
MARKAKSRGYSGFDLNIGPSYKQGWNREEHPTPAPNQECINCKRTGSCNLWNLSRVVNAFGREITQHQQVIECTYCLNEFVIGSLDFTSATVEDKTRGRKFNLRKLSPEDRRKLMALVEQEIKEGRIK